MTFYILKMASALLFKNVSSGNKNGPIKSIDIVKTETKSLFCTPFEDTKLSAEMFRENNSSYAIMILKIRKFINANTNWSRIAYGELYNGSMNSYRSFVGLPPSYTLENVSAVMTAELADGDDHRFNYYFTRSVSVNSNKVIGYEHSSSGTDAGYDSIACFGHSCDNRPYTHTFDMTYEVYMYT